ncbi:aminotransferase class V-fold PLP-dependent enzyme [Microbispora sp. H11081]|uniref:aminotransferase class V-fold PLP-dependent enzyme n=1 Tax=Microbispora sp. H11081 TaxID=2729107 RepID=UPI001474DFFA|nr:aminotransferase class V-fold PLP-dependent enzyme [Microbispora sp. H11081]
MSSPSDIPVLALDQLRATIVREHMTLDQAIETQYALVDAIHAVMGSDVYFTEDYGQVRELATVGFGGGGRPRATARVERALAGFFGTEDAVLVHGAGTGSIRAMLNASLRPGDNVVLHSAHPYKTTLPAMNHMGLSLHQVDFNDLDAVRKTVADVEPEGLYIQHVPQGLGDNHEITDIIDVARSLLGDRVKVIVDDNYAVMRSRRIGVQLGADASAFSLFKLLSPVQIGCVLGDEELISGIRRDLSSAGCQVQGPAAMQALRMLVFAPVALAVQNAAVIETTERINELVSAGRLPYVRGAVAAQPGIRCSVLVFDEPVAEAFVRSAWRNGSPSQSVGEEAQPEVLPLFTYLTSTFLKGMPGLEKYAIRINPMRGGASTILRVIEASLADAEFQKDVQALRS